MIYTLSFEDVVTGAVINTYTTMAAIVVPAASTIRGRILGLNVGPSDDSPPDVQIGIKVGRIVDVSAGSAGTKTDVAAANVARPDSKTPNPTLTFHHSYTAEPTAYAAESLWQHEINARGGVIHRWAPADAPMIGQVDDQLLGLLIAPRTAAAVRVSGSLIIEQL